MHEIENGHKCILGVISFHAGVYFGKYKPEFINFDIVV